MKITEANFEKLIRKVIRGRHVEVETFLDHWRGLEQGHRLLINQLNRHAGWPAFMRWAASHPGTRARLAMLADRAGVTAEAAELLATHDVPVSDLDSQRTRALWVRDAVIENRKEDLDRARSIVEADSDLLSGVLPLLETAPSHEVAAFLTTLLEGKPSKEMDHELRKTLYHLKQKGIEIEKRRSGGVEAVREMFAFSENQLPLFQTVLYFRPLSGFTDAGDFYVLQIVEGHDSKLEQQQKGLRLNKESLLVVAGRYAEFVSRQTGLKLEYQSVPPAHARYFLNRSLELLPSDAPAQALSDFRKFLGTGETSPPFPEAAEEPSQLSVQQASSILQAPYFSSWILPLEPLKDFTMKMKEIDNAPIILPESQIRERKQAAGADAIHGYFQEKNRRIWSFAFEKAAYFLRERDPQLSGSALTLSLAFAALNLSIESLPAASELFARTVQYIRMEEEQKKQEQMRSSLIMTPEEYLKSKRPGEQGR